MSANDVQNPDDNEAIVVSASGKVLLAGGYLVLDQKYSGVVVSTSSRFYTVVKKAGGGASAGRVRVRSPQFEDAEWEYVVEVDETKDDVRVVQDEQKAKNKFVFIALQITLRLVGEMRGVAHVAATLKDGLEVVIAGGNDFYSQRAKLAQLGLPPRLASLARLPAFAHTGGTLSNVHKTGLGSSAALVTSLVGALLAHFHAVSPKAFSPTTTTSSCDEAQADRALAHNAAQLAHCAAQGKVGSGFDVAAAAFGSHRYTRFAPDVIAPLMMSGTDDGAQAQKLLPVLGPKNGKWDYRTEPFALPPGTRLMLADVDAGSDTPSLVGKVLAWRKAAGAEADAFWDNLGARNDALAAALTRLSTLHVQDAQAYSSTVARLSGLPSTEWQQAPSELADPIVNAFVDVHRRAEDIRAGMREMGKLAGVPIEPPEQTELLDACIAQAGVIAGGVPGAGGYDAVWLLVLDHQASAAEASTQETPLNRVERVWASWKGLDVSPLSATESFEKGLQLVKVEDIPGLAEAVAA